MNAKIRLTNPLLPILVVCCFLMRIFDPSRIWTVTLILLGGLWLISYLWARSLARGLWLEREMRFGWAQVGDQLEERFQLLNAGWAPGLWIELVDHSNLPGHQTNRVTGVEGRAEIAWYVTSTCTRRGLYNLGPTTVRSMDPFGIYQVETTNQARRTIMVMPPIVALPGIQVAPGGRSGDGRPRKDAPDRTVSASGVRQYVPGDSLRWIHWPTSARRQEYFVRLFDGTPAGDWRILLDLNRQVQFGSGWDSTIEHGVILAASLADQGFRLKRSIGLTINGQPFTWLPERGDEAQRWEILRQLTLADAGDTSLEAFLHQLGSKLSSRSSLVIITSDTTGTWLEALLPMLWRGIKPTVLMLDPPSFAQAVGASTDLLPAIPLGEELTRYGVQHAIISYEFLNRPEARPGRAGRLDWRVTPRGRAVLVNQPADLGWKKLE